MTKNSAPVAHNKRAHFDINVERTFEAGIVLTSDEIKSIRAQHVQLTGGFVKLVLNRASATRLPEALLLGVQLSKAKDPVRNRKLLLNSSELRELQRLIQLKGNTVVPLKLYFQRGWAKVTLGVGAGRKNYDKRELLRRRDSEREQRRALKHV